MGYSFKDILAGTEQLPPVSTGEFDPSLVPQNLAGMDVQAPELSAGEKFAYFLNGGRLKDAENKKGIEYAIERRKSLKGAGLIDDLEKRHYQNRQDQQFQREALPMAEAIQQREDDRRLEMERQRKMMLDAARQTEMEREVQMRLDSAMATGQFTPEDEPLLKQTFLDDALSGKYTREEKPGPTGHKEGETYVDPTSGSVMQIIDGRAIHVAEGLSMKAYLDMYKTVKEGMTTTNEYDDVIPPKAEDVNKEIQSILAARQSYLQLLIDNHKAGAEMGKIKGAMEQAGPGGGGLSGLFGSMLHPGGVSSQGVPPPVPIRTMTLPLKTPTISEQLAKFPPNKRAAAKADLDKLMERVKTVSVSGKPAEIEEARKQVRERLQFWFGGTE